MAIAYVNAGSAQNLSADSGSTSIALPSSRTNGNLLVAVLSSSFNNAQTWPADWNVVYSAWNTTNYISIAWRIVDGTEASPSVTWPTTSGKSVRHVCFQYSGTLTDEPIGDFTFSTGNTSPHTSSQIETIGKDSSAIYIDVAPNGTTLTAPSGWTQNYANGDTGNAFSVGNKQLTGGAGTLSGDISSTGSAGAYWTMLQIELVQEFPPEPIDADATSTSASSTSTSGTLGIAATASSSGTASSESSYTFALGVFASSSGVVNGSISVVREKIAEALSEGELQDDLLVGLLANADALSVAIDASQVEVTRFTANVVNTGVTISGTASASRIYYEIGSSNATIGGTVDVLRTINVSVIASALLASGAIGNARYNLVAESLAQLISGIIYVNDYMDGWAYNLNIQAPSFYENFKFNSFAKIGNQYYGLNNEGLHLLGANDDNGAEINALITTGISDFGELRTKKIPVIYAGARTEKPLILTCSVDNNPDYSYEFISSSEGIAPTRVKLGKGLEGRYWKLEIANRDGGDFEISDLDIPITLNSRGV